MTKINSWLFSIITIDESKTTFLFKMFTKFLKIIIVEYILKYKEMKDNENSSDKLSMRVNALVIIDIQEKIIRPIFNKDSIVKNVKKASSCLPNLRRKYIYIRTEPIQIRRNDP